MLRAGGRPRRLPWADRKGPAPRFRPGRDRKPTYVGYGRARRRPGAAHGLKEGRIIAAGAGGEDGKPQLLAARRVYKGVEKVAVIPASNLARRRNLKADSPPAASAASPE